MVEPLTQAAEQAAPEKKGLVGRDAELRLMLTRWRQSRLADDGQVLLLSGPAGIGKSRLTRAMEAQATADGVRLLVLRCSPTHRNSALFPLVRLLRNEAGLVPGQSLQESRQVLQQWVRSSNMPEAEALPLLACVLGVSLAEPERLLSLSGAHKRQLQHLLTEWLRSLAKHRPLLFLVEDLHWADPSTLDFINPMLSAADGNRLMVLLTARPEFTPTWEASSTRSQVVLKHFGAADVEALVLRLTGGKRFPAELLRRIIGQTDGVPLHVEELTKLLMESGELVEHADHYELAGEPSAQNMPSSLMDASHARLERQRAGRQVAQLGAVVGREFSQQLITWLWEPAAGLLEEGIKELIEAELLYHQQLGEQVSYVFKHALVQEAAYASIEPVMREAFHARVHITLQERFPDLSESQPEALAHHCTKAGWLEQAIPLWLAAADRAIEASAHAEAVAHIHKAVQLQSKLPDSAERRRDAITLQIRLGVALAALRGYASGAVGQAYGLAREQAEGNAHCQDLLLPAQYGLWRFHLMRAEYPRARQLGQELLSLAHQAGNHEFQAMGHRALASTMFYVGDFQGAHTASSQVLQMEAQSQQRVAALRYDVVDAWVTATSYRAWSEWMLGDEAAAQRDALEAQSAARRLKHPFSLALSLSFAGWMHQFRGDAAALRQSAQEALAISQEHGFEFWIGWNEALLGWAVGIEANARLGAEQIAAGIQRWTATGSRLGKSYFLALQAQALLRSQMAVAAGQVLDEAQAFVEATGERFWEAELLRLRSQWMAAQGHSDDAVRACLARALAVARSQSAVALIKRCERSASLT
ncbi:MAG: AAA family ATPase [Burkholderiales bacterium]